MPHVRHELPGRPQQLTDIPDVQNATVDDDDVLVYDSGTSTWLHTPPYNTIRRQTAMLGFQVQAGPVGLWVPFESNFQLANGHNPSESTFTPNPAGPASTNIIGSWTPVALPTTHLDVDDASGFDTTSANKYVSITIPGGAVTVVRYSSITIGGGGGGSDRINLDTTTLDAGHRGIGTPAAGAVVHQATVEYTGDALVAQVMLMAGSVEAISGGVIGWRFRSASSAALYSAAEGVLNASTNTAEETAQVAKLATIGNKNVGFFVEFFSDTAGGTASQVRTDPIGFLAPSLGYSDFGQAVLS